MPSIPVNSLELNSHAVTTTAVAFVPTDRLLTYSNEFSSSSGRPASRQGIESRLARLRAMHEASLDTSRSKFEWDKTLLWLVYPNIGPMSSFTLTDAEFQWCK